MKIKMKRFIYVGFIMLVSLCFWLPSGKSVEAAARRERLIDSCENMAVVHESTLDTSNFIEGGGSLVNSGLGPIFILDIVGFEQMASYIPFQDAYIEFYLWVDMPENLVGDSQLEFNDQNDYDDENEISWNLAAVNPSLSSGWNYVCLKFTNAGKVGEVDYNKISYMRLYFGSPNGATLRLDGIKLVDAPLTLSPEDITGQSASKNVINYIVDPNVKNHGRMSSAQTALAYSLGGVVLGLGVSGAVVILFFKQIRMFLQKAFSAQKKEKGASEE